MSWIAEYDTHGKEFPTCVHVTKTMGAITHGATYVPIEDGGAVRAEKAALERRIDELCAEVEALKRDEWAAGFSAGCEAVEAAYEDGKAHYEDENAELREYAAKAWSLFIRHGAVHACDLSEVDVVRDGLRELGIEVDNGTE